MPLLIAIIGVLLVCAPAQANLNFAQVPPHVRPADAGMFVPPALPHPIFRNATISLDIPDFDDTVLREMQQRGQRSMGMWAILAGVSLLALGTSFQMHRVQKQLKALQKMQKDNAPHQTMAGVLHDLCAKNQLTRLAAIQQLGRMAVVDEAAAPRLGTILCAYLRAINNDKHLRQSASSEVHACLHELSEINRFMRLHGIDFAFDLTGLDFSNMRLKGCFFSSMDFYGATFHHSVIENCSFDQALCEQASFNGAHLKNCTMVDTALAGSEWENTTFDAISGMTAEQIAWAAASVPQSQRRAGEKHGLRPAGNGAMWLNQEPIPVDKSKLH